MHFNPHDDGITHINIYSKARTPLGRMLSNFYNFPINTKYGRFECLESYYFYNSLKDVASDNELSKLQLCLGPQANGYGNNLCEKYKDSIVYDDSEEFRNEILSLIRIKFEHNSDLLLPEYELLPMYHYYVFGDTTVDVTDKYKWYVNGIMNIRDEIVENRSISEVYSND